MKNDEIMHTNINRKSMGSVFRLNGNFKCCNNAIKWYRSKFGNKTMKEIEHSWHLFPEAEITFNKIASGELPYYG